ncbi:Calx-beta domain-containing protein, partial [Psychrobacter sp. Ps6]|uniref:Calx-beta domain-containing protein n=1 Tax=Psychrobacter sp. Ps6 TaxID=2790960 RepID=UPI001EDFACA9
MNTIIVKTNSATQTVAQAQVVTEDGKPTIIKAVDKVNYEFHDTAIGRAPNHIITKRLKNDLHISFEEDGRESDLIIEGFYDEADSALLGIAEDGEYYYYIPDTGETYDYVTQLETGDVEGQALGGTEYIAAAATPWWIPAAAGLGLAGLVVGLSSGGGDDDGKPIEPAPIVSLGGVTSLSEANADNEANTALYTVTLDKASATDTTVTVTITPGSANGDDYIAPVTQTVMIPAGQTSAVFSVPIVNDDIYEGAESFRVAITSVSSGRAAIDTANSTVETTVYDDGTTDGTTPVDPNNPTAGSDIPVVNIAATDAQAIEGVDNTLIFSVTQSNLSNLDTTVTVTLGASNTVEAADIASISYTNADGVVVSLTTSAQIQDFLTNGANVTIPAGQTTAPVITVTIADDVVYEQTEDLVLEISTPVNATIGTDSATGVILDESNDPANPGSNTEGDKPVVSVSDASADEGGILTHTVTLSNPTEVAVSYPFVISDDTATVGSDYDNAPVFSNGVVLNADGTITIPAGVTSFTVSYPALNDDLDELTETTTLTIGTGVGTGTITDTDLSPVINITASGDATEGAGDSIVFSINQTGLSDRTTSVIVTLDLTDAQAADIDSIVLTNADGSTQTISVVDAIAGVSVSIPAGTELADMPRFSITPVQDAIYEISETIGMSLSGPVNATLGTVSVTGAILDENGGATDAPVVNIAATDAQAIEGVDNTLIFSVTQSNLSNLD